ncbi:MAG TPA: S-methyl-5-thioribose-1-phosphate isomerase [Solirubrobacteraceae bacterium]|jgi:methylthioribose-1-phosphate isomerase
MGRPRPRRRLRRRRRCRSRIDSERTPIVALRYSDGALHAIDQTALPWRELELELRSAADVADAIRRLCIRGAPLIGVAAGYGLAIELAHEPGDLQSAAATLRGARPTAVNLAHAVDRVAEAASELPLHQRAAAALAQARAIHLEEEAASTSIARHGAELLAGARRILTHCNTGALAAPGRGTALAVLAELADRGELQLVLVTESRPLLQGARLTVYELRRLGIEHELLVDGAAAGLIASHDVDAVIVGCDRVAANGDVANKVGTYALALAASAAAIPFVVAGPSSTIDLSASTGAEIAIEERGAEEVLAAPSADGPAALSISGTRCRNPAFDLTPASLITALVTERGVARPPSAGSISSLLASA